MDLSSPIFLQPCHARCCYNSTAFNANLISRSNQYVEKLLMKPRTKAVWSLVAALCLTLIAGSVIAIHEPSGTSYETVTRADGRFAMQNMRIGGPYTVTVNYVGAGTAF